MCASLMFDTAIRDPSTVTVTEVCGPSYASVMKYLAEKLYWTLGQVVKV